MKTFALVIHAADEDVLSLAAELRAKAAEWAADDGKRLALSGEVATNMVDVFDALILYHERTR